LALVLPRQLDYHHPAVAGAADRDVRHLHRFSSPPSLMWSDIVIVTLHPCAELVCAVLVRQAPHHCRALLEGPVQPLHNIVVWLGFKIPQHEVGFVDRGSGL